MALKKNGENVAAKKSKKQVKTETKSEGLVSPSSDETWKHENDARTLKEAAEIMADPERIKNAHKHHKKVKKAMRSVDDLIKHRNEKFGAKSSDHDEDDEV